MVNEIGNLARDEKHISRLLMACLFSANGTFLCQPRVQRREPRERRGTLGWKTPKRPKPQGGDPRYVKA